MANREQRRAAKGKPNAAQFMKKAKENYVAELELKRMLHEAYESGNKAGFYGAVSMMCYELHNLYGFGGRRLTRLITKCADLGDSIDKGYVSMMDVNDILKEECSVSMNFDHATGKWDFSGPDWRKDEENEK